MPGQPLEFPRKWNSNADEFRKRAVNHILVGLRWNLWLSIVSGNLCAKHFGRKQVHGHGYFQCNQAPQNPGTDGTFPSAGGPGLTAYKVKLRVPVSSRLGIGDSTDFNRPWLNPGIRGTDTYCPTFRHTIESVGRNGFTAMTTDASHESRSTKVPTHQSLTQPIQSTYPRSPGAGNFPLLAHNHSVEPLRYPKMKNLNTLELKLANRQVDLSPCEWPGRTPTF